MKAGLTLTELAKEIDRRAKSKKDFIAPVSKVRMAVGRNEPIITLEQGKVSSTFGMNKVAHEQVAEFAGIPMPYYRRMLENDPALLAGNVNRWMKDRADDRRMIRTLDGKVRALLSDKYRTLENEDLAETVLPVLLDRDLLIMSCDITDQRLYIKAVDKKILKDVPTGKTLGNGHEIFDTISPAITISTSEVGRGSVLVESGIFTKMCTNLATFGASMRKFHTGARAEMSDDVYALMTDKTKKMTDAAVWAQVRDIVAGAFDKAKFDAIAGNLAAAGEDRLPKKSDVVEVIERVGRKVGLNDTEKKGVLQCLIEDGNLSRYGVHSAITRLSQDVDDYDRATELERAGARVIELNKGEWEQIAKAA